MPVRTVNPLPHPLPLRTDGATLGLRRLVVPTSVGEVVVRTGREAGGPATILLHGAAGSWTTWTPLLAASDLTPAPLQDVVVLDLPGWGESGRFDRVGSVDDMSDAVVEVARALGYSNWRVVGHSLGGFIALDLAARYPDATLGVTLVSSTGRGTVDAIRRPLRGGRALPWFAGMLLSMRLLALVRGAGIVRLLRRLGGLRALSSPLFAGEVHPSVIAAFADEVRPAAFTRAARLAAAYEERTWSAIRCPVRSVRGARDVFAGEADAGAFVALIPDFGEVRLHDAGHFANIERPDAVLTTIDATARIRLGVTARRLTEIPFTDEARRLVRTRSGVSRP
ncbi:MAG: alpha/beta fold hydrolase [Microbacterium sp.]